MTDCRITVLISGSGTNLQALIDATKKGGLNAALVHVISNRRDAAGLQRAISAGIPTGVIEHGDFSSREDFDAALGKLMASRSPDLVVLAGFMRILGSSVVSTFKGRMINLHPSLLPLYRGTDTYRRAIAAGDRQHGASIHFVTGELDGGPVISQVCIPIEPQDDPVTLASRLAPREHDLIVSTIRLFSQGLISCRNSQVFLDRTPLARPLKLQADGSFLE